MKIDWIDPKENLPEFDKRVLVSQYVKAHFIHKIVGVGVLKSISKSKLGTRLCWENEQGESIQVYKWMDLPKVDKKAWEEWADNVYRKIFSHS